MPRNVQAKQFPRRDLSPRRSCDYACVLTMCWFCNLFFVVLFVLVCGCNLLVFVCWLLSKIFNMCSFFFIFYLGSDYQFAAPGRAILFLASVVGGDSKLVQDSRNARAACFVLFCICLRVVLLWSSLVFSPRLMWLCVFVYFLLFR